MSVERLGAVVATPRVMESFSGEELADCLARHMQGDWGDVGAYDWAANDQALRHGTRLLSAYELPGGRRLWIITEADRSSTTLLLPEDY